MAAVVGGLAGLLGSVLAWRLGYFTRRHEQLIRVEVENHVGRVRLDLERSLKSHEARLRIASEGRLRLTEKMITDVGQLRTKLNEAGAAIHKFALEAYLNGASPRARELQELCNDALRACPTAGPFVPPEVLEPAAHILNDLTEVLADVANWSNLSEIQARRDRCKQSDTALQERVAPQMRSLFGDWFRGQLAKQEEALAALERGAGAAPVLAAPASELGLPRTPQVPKKRWWRK